MSENIDELREITAQVTSSDEANIDRAIRPKLLSDYVGQPTVNEQMEIYIPAARKRAYYALF